ncbi:MAG: carboxypeptidase regulatory-like domain-containing protein [Thermoproteales archaeon]|nr:carboxypeptidase regulatory-like domain-containing protein [Thermoproteales archaeon]
MLYGMGVSKKIVVASLITLFLVSLVSVQSFSEKNVESVPVRVNFILRKSETKKIVMSPGDEKVFSLIPAPPGYDTAFLKVAGVDALPSSIEIKGADKIVVDEGKVLAAVSFNGTLGLVNKENSTVEVEVEIEQVFIKTVYFQLDSNGVVKINIEKPVEPFKLSELTVKLTVENYLPYRIVDVLAPNGDSLLSSQEDFTPESISVDPHHLEIRFSDGFTAGVYSVKLVKDSEAVMPSAFLILEKDVYYESVAPGGVKKFTANETAGNNTKLLGFIVAVHATRIYSPERSNVKVLGELVDYAFYESRTFSVRASSYLIPPLDFRFWMKAFIVFGKEFTVVNTELSTVDVIYIPVYIKEIGSWKPAGLVADVTGLDVSAFKYAFLVVQLPPFAKVKNLITPGGVTLNSYIESSLPWNGQSERDISVLSNELYIQVKNDETSEVGVYKVEIEWEKIKIQAVDSLDRPLKEATVALEQEGIIIEKTTDDNGWAEISPFKPGVFTVKVMFKDSIVFEQELIYPPATPWKIKCNVHDVIVKVKSMLGTPVSNATVAIVREDGMVLETAKTNSSGIAKLIQIPAGNYTVEIEYKRISKTVRNVVVDGSTVNLEETIDMLFEIPILGVPVKLEEGLAGGVTTVALAVAIYLTRRRHGEKINEEILEELP